MSDTQSLAPALYLGAAIACPYDKAYAALSDPATWSQWAAGLGGGLVREADGLWRLTDAEGRPARMRVTAPNPFGVLDHSVLLPGGGAVDVPMRITARPGGCDVVLTLLRMPQMTDAQFEADAQAMRRDLAALKAVLEADAP